MNRSIGARHYRHATLQPEEQLLPNLANMAAGQLSDFERQRQANIAERDALLKKLQLDAASAGLVTKKATATGAARSSTKKKSAPQKIKEEVVPRRTSSRIKGIEADSSVAKRKAEQEHEVAQEAARLKRQRVSGELNLQDIMVVGNGWDTKQNVFVDVVNRGAQPYERTFGDDEVKTTTDKELRGLREKMSGLELYEGFAPNGTFLRRIEVWPSADCDCRYQDDAGTYILYGFPPRAVEAAHLRW